MKFDNSIVEKRLQEKQKALTEKSEKLEEMKKKTEDKAIELKARVG